MASVPRFVAAALCLALVFTVPATDSAWAQSDYSDAKLESFVKAAIQVENLMREYKPRVDRAESPQRADSLRAEAKAKMEATIEQTPGITLDEYGRILVAADTDQALHDRIDTIYRATKAR